MKAPAENNHEETKKTKKEQKKVFVLFVSSWLIFILFQASRRDMNDSSMRKRFFG
jgi:hypothetical protein